MWNSLEEAFAPPCRQLWVRIPCTTVSVLEQEKQLFLLCGLYFEAMCHNSNLHTPNQANKQKKKISLLFSVYLAFYVAPCKEEAPPLLFRENVNGATKFL